MASWEETFTSSRSPGRTEKRSRYPISGTSISPSPRCPDSRLASPASWRKPSRRRDLPMDGARRPEYRAMRKGSDARCNKAARTRPGENAFSPASCLPVAGIAEIRQQEGAVHMRHDDRRRRCKVTAVQLPEARHAEQPQHLMHLRLEQFEHPRDTRLPGRGERVAIEAPQPDQLGAHG